MGGRFPRGIWLPPIRAVGIFLPLSMKSAGFESA
jgi:hypothetical protein